MSRLPESGSSEDRIRQLERRVQQLERADRLGNTSFREPGVVRFRDTDGNVRIRMGRLVTLGGADVGVGLVVEDADGTDLAILTDAQRSLNWAHKDGTIPRPGFAVVESSQQLQARYPSAVPAGIPAFLATANQVQIRTPTDDAVLVGTSEGLLRPNLGFFMARANMEDEAATASSSFVDCHFGYVVKWQPDVRVFFRVRVDADTVGQVRLVDTPTGTVIATSSTFSSASFTQLEGTLPGDLRSVRRLALQVQRVSGAGLVHVAVFGGFQL